MYSGAERAVDLYDDQGSGFGYTRGAFSWTRIVHAGRGRHSTITIGPARGRFRGALVRRSWKIRLVAVGRPGSVRLDGRPRAWSYDAPSRTLTVDAGLRPTDRRITVTVTSGRSPSPR